MPDLKTRVHTRSDLRSGSTRALLGLTLACLTWAGCDAAPALPDAGPGPDLLADGGGVDTRPDVVRPDAAPDLTGDRGPDVETDATPDAADLPPDLPPETTIGRGCTVDKDCESGQICATEETRGLPGGYCTNPCILDDPTSCEPGSVCGVFGADTVCARSCTASSDCRTGYFCAGSLLGFTPPGGEQLCAPGRPGARLGEACSAQFDCEPGNGICVSGLGFSYCSAFCDPAAEGSCGAGGSCVQQPGGLGGGGLCAATCEDQAGCREGQSCVSAFNGQVATATVCAWGDLDSRVGDPCVDDTGCPAGLGTCFAADASGNPGGYCHTLCDPAVAKSCGADGECLSVGLCVDRCAQPTDCRQGYSCVEDFVGFDTVATVCAPGIATPVAIGQQCADSSECTAGSQLCLTETAFPGLPGGYCSSTCNVNDDPCAVGSTCVQGSPEGGGYCYASCEADADCDGLRSTGTSVLGCSVRLGDGVRVPGDGRVCTPVTPTAAIGDPCVNGTQCTSGLGRCLFASSRTAPFFTGGYCTLDCDPAAAQDTCGAAAVCHSLARGSSLGGSCLERCTQDSECRETEGYRCLPSSSGATACLPPPT